MKKKKKSKPIKAKEEELNQQAVPQNDSIFNFGGLPTRDLKKNIGCS